jgi:hypothetical protein
MYSQVNQSSPIAKPSNVSELYDSGSSSTDLNLFYVAGRLSQAFFLSIFSFLCDEKKLAIGAD